MKNKIELPETLLPVIKKEYAAFKALVELVSEGKVNVAEIAKAEQIEQVDLLLDVVIVKMTNEVLPVVKGNKRHPNGFAVDRKNHTIIFDRTVLDTGAMITHEFEVPKNTKRKSKNND